MFPFYSRQWNCGETQFFSSSKSQGCGALSSLIAVDRLPNGSSKASQATRGTNPASLAQCTRPRHTGVYIANLLGSNQAHVTDKRPLPAAGPRPRGRSQVLDRHPDPFPRRLLPADGRRRVPEQAPPL